MLIIAVISIATMMDNSMTSSYFPFGSDGDRRPTCPTIERCCSECGPSLSMNLFFTDHAEVSTDSESQLLKILVAI